jgi:predicted metal-dependent phosphoesterase TrpH
LRKNNEIKADLHIHTYYSDGKYSPSELLSKVKETGLSCIAITDHDNVDGIDEAIFNGKELGIEVIPGVELSSDLRGKEVHVLGYFIEYRNPELLAYLKSFRNLRIKRAEKIVEKLNELKVPLRMSNVLEKAKGNASIGRPHIAFALMEENYVDNYSEAFIKYIGDNKPAYEKKPNVSTKEAIQLIANSGGLSFIAHPGRTMRDDLVIEIMELGVDGFEVYHPSHTSEDIRYFHAIAGQYFLLESGGSDFHGGRMNDDSVLGCFGVSEMKVDEMKHRLFLNRSE